MDAAEVWAAALEQLVAMHLRDEDSAIDAAPFGEKASPEVITQTPPEPSLPPPQDASLPLPPPVQVHGDAALSRSRSSFDRNNISSRSSSSSSIGSGIGDRNHSSLGNNSSSQSTTSTDTTDVKQSEEHLSAAAAEHQSRRASDAVNLRRRIAAARAADYGGSHQSTLEAALALVKSLELRALCLDNLEEQQQRQQQSERQLTAPDITSVGVLSGHYRTVPCSNSLPRTDNMFSPTFMHSSTMETTGAEIPSSHKSDATPASSTSSADSCRCEAAQLRAAIAHTNATAAAKAPLPLSAYVPAYATNQPSGKGAPPVPMGYGGIPGGIGGHLGNIS